jgi:hypothetical protein
MMRILGLLFGVGLAVIVAAWFAGELAATGRMKRAGDEQWPAGLGTLASVEARVRPQKTNDGARRMVALAAPLGISFKTSADKDAVRTAISEYVRAEHVRSESTIGEPPAEVLSYLTAHEAEIDALRDHLLGAESIAWELDASKGFDAPLPNLLGHMDVARLLTTRALLRARDKDVRAWDDLQAAWRLTHTLEARPELISQLIVLAMGRMVNAAAWKLPVANVAWLDEMRNVDHRRLLLGAFQYDTWMMWRHGEESANGAMLTITRPYQRWSVADMTRRQRLIAEEVAAMTACGLDGEAFSQRVLASIPRWNVFARIATPNLGSVWQRALRAIAEREATRNAMRIAEGQPIVATSVCSDGTWRFENDRLSFSRDLPKSNENEIAMPLSLAIPARGTRRST